MTDRDFTGRTILAIVTNYGVEQDELMVPMRHLTEAGARVDVAAVSAEPIQTLVGDKEPGETVEPTTTLDEVDPAAYDLLLIPGGTINADTLRQQQAAVSITRAFIETGRPTAAICHGPWTLVETGALTGKRLTSYPSLQTDVRNAGGVWVDDSAVVDDRGWTLITSRSPKDLPDFTAAIDRALAAVPA